MTDKGHTSSMTSVTEEDTSADSESDTTESSYSNITSSFLSSTDTDDKLTPGLFNISISSDSKTIRSRSKEQKHSDAYEHTVDTESITNSKIAIECDRTTNEVELSGYSSNSSSTSFVYRNDSISSTLADPRIRKKRPQKDLHSSLLKSNFNKTHMCSSLPLNTSNKGGCKENLGVDDTNDNLSTDFSDTSSRKGDGDKSNNNEFEEESDEKSNCTTDSVNNRPFLPDMNSRFWYQAGCFDRYWNHYNFVMEWYQKHVQAVEILQRQANFPWSPSLFRFWNQPPQSPSQRSRRNRKSKRARSRRKAKSRQKSGTGDSASISVTDEATHTDSSQSVQGLQDLSDEEEDLEMEITKEMMEFFTTSFKHKIERDSEKKGSDGNEEKARCNIEEAEASHKGPSSEAPIERPGVRRTAEMKELYGAGAPMIHGMETALQMTYDRISDRFQPKLWPNMPLKIIFS